MYTDIFLVVQPVVQPVVQRVASCIRGFTDNRPTDGRRHSEHEHEFTFAKNGNHGNSLNYIKYV